MRSQIRGLTAVVAFVSLPLLAQSARTFVSASGSDMNGCSIASPCRSLQRGVDAVAANGEVVPLDTAGYGVMTISKSVTVAVPAGVYGGVSASMGQNGVSINTAGIDVKLRGLSINSLGGSDGVFVAAA